MTFGETHESDVAVEGVKPGEKIVVVGVADLKDGDFSSGSPIRGIEQMAHENEQDISNRRNIPRFFVEHPHISWMLLVGVLVWGWFGYTSMPQRKDPEIPVRVAVAACPWPGATAQQVEQFVTRRIEDVAAENKTIHPGTDADYGIKSISLPGYSFVYLQLDEGVTDTKRQFSDINLKLNALNSQLPQGAGPISFQSDFGDTAALMLTVASPKVDDIEIAARANSVEAAIRKARELKTAESNGPARHGRGFAFHNRFRRAKFSTPDTCFKRKRRVPESFEIRKSFREADLSVSMEFPMQMTAAIRAFIQRFMSERLKRSELHPDAWELAIIRDPSETRAKLASVAGDKYSYADLDNFSDLIGRTLQGATEVSKVETAGCFAAEPSIWTIRRIGSQPTDCVLPISPKYYPPGTSLRRVEVLKRPTAGSLSFLRDNSIRAKSIGDVAVSTTSEGAPVYLRDLVQISRGYQAPAQYLNYYTWQDKSGRWQRSRADYVGSLHARQKANRDASVSR